LTPVHVAMRAERSAVASPARTTPGEAAVAGDPEEAEDSVVTVAAEEEETASAAAAAAEEEEETASAAAAEVEEEEEETASAAAEEETGSAVEEEAWEEAWAVALASQHRADSVEVPAALVASTVELLRKLSLRWEPPVQRLPAAALPSPWPARLPLPLVVLQPPVVRRWGSGVLFSASAEAEVPPEMPVVLAL